MSDSIRRALIFGPVSVFVFLSSAALYHDPGTIPWLLIIATIIIALGIGIGWGIWAAHREDKTPQP